MPTYCTVPARYRRIRSNSLSSSGRFAGRPDSSDHTSGPGPAALPKPSQLPESSKPECASVSLFGRAPARDTRIAIGPNTDTLQGVVVARKASPTEGVSASFGVGDPRDHLLPS